MKIQNKLFLTLFGFSLLLVAVLVLLMQWSIGKGMVEYVNTKEIETLRPIIIDLAAEYQTDNSWRSMHGQHEKFRRFISKQLRGSEFELDPKHRGFDKPPKKHRLRAQNRPAKDGFHKEKRPPSPRHKSHYALLDNDDNLVVGGYLRELTYSKVPIQVDEQTVGYFAVSKRNNLTEGYELDFIQQQQSYLWVIAVFVSALVALAAFPLARHLTKPIKRIASGMHKLTQGDYQQSIELQRKDELGELSRDYNELALTLSENDTARKRWLANISHELRTPVAILRGELEAMLDGIRSVTRDNVASAHDEVKHLQRLIDDLNLLASADIGGMRYRKQHHDLTLLMQDEIDKYDGYLADAGIKLTLDIYEQEIDIYGDETRLCQLFDNIVNNCVKYSFATAFNISVSVETTDTSFAKITLEDNGIGVDDSHLKHLFEHLYRVEDSRNRKTGGSGLGLSICRHIVHAHHGDIMAERSNLGGLAIIIRLPIALVSLK